MRMKNKMQEVNLFGKAPVEGLGCCGTEYSQIFDCIIKACMALEYFHLSNPNSPITEHDLFAGNELIKAIETSLNKNCLLPDQPPRSVKTLLDLYIQEFGSTKN